MKAATDDDIETAARALAICRLRRQAGPAAWDGLLDAVKAQRVKGLLTADGEELRLQAMMVLHSVEARRALSSPVAVEPSDVERFTRLASTLVRRMGGKVIVPTVELGERATFSWQPGVDKDGDEVVIFESSLMPSEATN